MFVQADTENRLLRSLPQAEFRAVAQHAEAIAMPKDFIMARQGEEIDYCYFMDEGIGSIVVRSPEGHQAEAGLFGRDGCRSLGLTCGVTRSAFQMFVQVEGAGHRISTEAFAGLMASAPTFAAKLRLYAHVMSLQATYTSLSNAVHQIDERLARWLLMCHDRSGSDEIPLTHEFLSIMLAVRRPSVTTALHTLEGNRFIRAERGYVTIRDREGLEQFAADAYGAPEAEHQRLLGSWR